MSRFPIMMLIVAVFMGCGHRHEAVWPEHRARGSSKPFQAASYSIVLWQDRYGGMNYPRVEVRGSTRPGFSVRLPDGTVLTPDRITIDRTEATLEDDSGRGRRVAVFDYANGRLKVEFGTFDDAKQIAGVLASGWPGQERDIPGSELAVGNPDGTKLVVLPATRDELVEVFGKPGLEMKSAKKWCLGPC